MEKGFFPNANKITKEEKLANTDAVIFDYSSNKIIWARTIPDIRWGEMNYTDIVIFDLNTKKEKTISKKGKYLSPALSPDATKIAAIQHLSSQETYLLAYSASQSWRNDIPLSSICYPHQDSVLSQHSE